MFKQLNRQAQAVFGGASVRRRQRVFALTLAGAVLVMVAIALLGCAQAPLSSTSSAPMGSSTSTQRAVTSSSTTAVSLSAGKPVEVYRLGDQEQLWKAWIRGDYVIWMESPGPPGPILGSSMLAASGTVLRFVDIAGGGVQEVPGSRLAAPKPATASSMVRPALRKGDLCARASAITSAPAAGAARR